MKLQKINIKNYKSIVNTTIDLSKGDNILSLIGQNESGKSSILEAIRDYYQGSFEEDSFPYGSKVEDLKQNVSCTFVFDKSDNIKEIEEKIEAFANDEVFDKPVKFKKSILKNLLSITISYDGTYYSFGETLTNIITHNIELLEVEPLANSDQAVDEKQETQEENETEDQLDGKLLFPDLPEFLVKKKIQTEYAMRRSS